MRTFTRGVALCMIALIAQPSHPFGLIFPSSIKDNYAIWYVYLPGESPAGVTWTDLLTHVLEEWEAELPHLTLEFVEDESAAGCRVATDGRGTIALGYGGQCGISDPPPTNGTAYPIGEWEYFEDGTETLLVTNTDILLFESTMTTNSTTGRVYSESFQVRSAVSATAHEIGHGLGLGHTYIAASLMGNTTLVSWAIYPSSRREQYNHLLQFRLPSVDDICGAAVISGRRDLCAIGLGPGLAHTPGALELDPTNAFMAGYASSDAGYSQASLFNPDESVDVYATITLPYEHWLPHGQTAGYDATPRGALHVFAQLEGDSTLYARDETGSWNQWVEGEDYPVSQLIPDQQLNYGYWKHQRFAQEIHILGNNGSSSIPAVTGANLGLQGRTVRFWIGYTMDEEPDRLIYSPNPIRLEWASE